MTQYWKVLRADLKHYGFQYREGLNIDTVHFNPSGECLPGGLYYTDTYNIPFFFHYGTKIARVTIPKGTRVHHEGNKSKADRLILSDIVDIKDWCMWKDYKVCLNAVKLDFSCSVLRYVKYRDMSVDEYTEICLEAVRVHGMMLCLVNGRFAKHRYYDICVEAVKRNTDALMFARVDLLKDKYAFVCLEAVKQDNRNRWCNYTLEDCRNEAHVPLGIDILFSN